MRPSSKFFDDNAFCWRLRLPESSRRLDDTAADDGRPSPSAINWNAETPVSPAHCLMTRDFHISRVNVMGMLMLNIRHVLREVIQRHN